MYTSVLPSQGLFQQIYTVWRQATFRIVDPLSSRHGDINVDYYVSMLAVAYTQVEFLFSSLLLFVFLARRCLVCSSTVGASNFAASSIVLAMGSFEKSFPSPRPQKED